MESLWSSRGNWETWTFLFMLWNWEPLETRQLTEAMDSLSYHDCCHLSSPLHLHRSNWIHFQSTEGAIFSQKNPWLVCLGPTSAIHNSSCCKKQQQHHQHHHHHNNNKKDKERQRNWGTDARCHDELLASSTLGDLLMSGERKLQDGDTVVRDRPCGNDPWNGEHLIPCLPQSWFSGKWMYLQYSFPFI